MAISPNTSYYNMQGTSAGHVVYEVQRTLGFKNSCDGDDLEVVRFEEVDMCELKMIFGKRDA